MLVYGGSLQYSMPYLKSEVKDLQLPDFINHLIPLVEAQFSTPVANNFGNSFITIGTVNPGVIWVGSYFQIGLEAIIPVNRDSGTGIGVLGQLHLYLDDMFPSSYGQPLIGGTSTLPANQLSEVLPCINHGSGVPPARGAHGRPQRTPTLSSTTRAPSSAARSLPRRAR